MTNLKKATPETSMSEIADRFMTNGSLTQQETAELLFNAFRLLRRLENAMLEQVKEKRETDAERMARVAERKEIETADMRLIRKERERQEAARERIVAADKFMDALDAELTKQEEALAQETVAEVAAIPAASIAPQAVSAPIKAPTQHTATSQAAAALRAQVASPEMQRARPTAPAQSQTPSAPARPLNTRGAFTGGMPRNSFGG